MGATWTAPLSPLIQVPVGEVWGIGKQTQAFLLKYGKRTALDFARCSEAWVRKQMTKPLYELWQELNGQSVLPLTTEEKTSYQSIQKVKTFTRVWESAFAERQFSTSKPLRLE